MLDRIHLRAAAGAATLAIGMLCAAPLAAQETDQITINGNPVDVEPAPIVQDGRVFVPLRGVFEQLGASVVYDAGEIDATEGSTEISLHIGSTQATVNGSETIIDVAPFIVGESAYIPLRFVSQALGADVSYDDADRIVAITTANGSQQDYQGNDQTNAPNFYESGYDVNQAPPPLPDYEQPPVPEPNDIWQPGCWAWSPAGYYWVPGTWVQPPAPQLVWTPGFWSFALSAFGWHPGYWANQVGYYGGVHYGGGYNGQGYDGGRWQDGAFHYNSAVTNVSNVTNTTIINNTYHTVVNNVVVNRTSYNGGPNGIVAQPTIAQEAVARERHFPVTAAQRQNAEVASQDRRLLASVNAGRPPVAAVARPLTPESRPANFVPVTGADREAAQRLVVRPKPTTARPRPIPAAARPNPRYVAPAARPQGVVAPAARPAHVAPAPQVKYVAPAAKPAAPVERPAPQSRYVAPAAWPAAPIAHPAPQPKYVAPAVRPATPVEHSVPQPKYVAPVARPAAPVARPAPPVEHPAAPVAHPAPAAAHPAAIVHQPVRPPAPRPPAAKPARPAPSEHHEPPHADVPQ